MDSLEEKATWQLHAFKNAKWQATIINMQQMQQVSGQSRSSEQREGKWQYQWAS